MIERIFGWSLGDLGIHGALNDVAGRSRTGASEHRLSIGVMKSWATPQAQTRIAGAGHAAA